MLTTPSLKRVLVTGGAGFIGSAVIRQYIAETHAIVINVDALTYAGNLNSLSNSRHHRRHIFEKVDIRHRNDLDRVFDQYKPNAVMHLAAESHVDRSIAGPSLFIDTNVTGTLCLLEATRSYWQKLDKTARETFRFHHVSTDEVYGDLGPNDPAFTEETPYAPSSPYSASKAASDHLVRAWYYTYGLPIVITNCSNNYGPYQFPEKLIPLMIINALEKKPLPIYGTGDNIRDWLYVEDHARALRHVLQNGRLGRTYNIGGRCERSNLEIVQTICRLLSNQLSPCPETAGDYASGDQHAGFDYNSLITFVDDRPGHDQRYAIDDTRIATELGWSPKESFETGLDKTIRWYLHNSDWVNPVRSRQNYQQWIETNYTTRRIMP